ncbi:ribonuclease R [Arenimonas maotaiensis]|uniref:Ribonuclease R n=1 Tax=Arenimonas maotaiensis TaxID=1446479 RepID=A0A917CKG1_9GAMM|nr:ribonuclease R [Arenimonas maotaiensis]GGF91650.1 ribonuclease R [Arenimonas maotaiensis]
MKKTPKNKNKSALPAWMPDSMKKAGSGQAKKAPKGPAKAAGGRGKPGKSAGPASGGRYGATQDPHHRREAGNYENPILSREGLLQFLRDADGPLSLDDLAKALKLTAPDRYEALQRRLQAMVRDGQLLLNRRGGYAPTAALDLLAGTVVAHPDGFGFVKFETGGEDGFLNPSELRKCFHGDRVLVNVINLDHKGRRNVAIAEVLERRHTRITGRFNLRAGIATVVPDDKRLMHEVLIGPDDRNAAKDGQLVVAEITSPPESGRPPIGRVLVVLGDTLTPSKVVEMAIYGHNLPHEFPEPVLREADAVPVDVPAEDLAGRVDIRHLPLVTIDGEDAKDFDDAVYCEANAEGFRLVVAIADVSHYVRPGSALDDEAVNRGTSVYFPGFVVPMLPENLSNGICSLKPKVDRLCFVCDMQVGFDGLVTRSRFYEAVMHSHARLTYSQVWQVVGEGDEAQKTALGPLLPAIERLHQLYGILAKARAQRGAIEFESGEVRFELDARGEVIRGGLLARNDAHKLIEECMIAANVEAGKAVLREQVPAPFRVHDRPPESKYADLLEYLKEFSLSLPSYAKVQPKDFTNLLKKVRQRPDAALLETVLLRSQSLAVYGTDNKGHFGLALEAYSHFTSPIRRYPDLLLHRALKKALVSASDGGFRYEAEEMARLCLVCSEKERRADEAEREVDERYRSAWMAQHVGSQFDGVISGVTSFGLFVELTDSKVNGLVHVTQLPHDYWHFDPLRKTLTGERKRMSFRLGDPIRVLVLRASVEDKRIDFKPVFAEAEKKKKAWAEE